MLEVTTPRSAEDLFWGELLAAADPNVDALPLEDGASDPNGEAEDCERAAKPDDAKAAEDVRGMGSEVSLAETVGASSGDLELLRAVKGEVTDVSVKPLVREF